jgi:hypothetical protein
MSAIFLCERSDRHPERKQHLELASLPYDAAHLDAAMMFFDNTPSQGKP